MAAAASEEQDICCELLERRESLECSDTESEFE
jgi:hypothetical protein